MSAKGHGLFQKVIRPQFLILLVATILVSVWFRKGLMLATGENAIIFDRIPRLLEIVRYAWGDAALGGPNVVSASSIPFYVFASFLVDLGFPGVFIQASTFWLLLVAQGLSTFYLMREFVKDERGTLTAIIAGLFYMLNPYAMIEIWNRFQYTYMFFYSTIPLILLLYVRGLKKKRLRYAPYLGLASLLSAYSYGSVPLIGTFWLVIIAYTIFHIIVNLRESKAILFTIGLFTLTFTVWFAVNSWWLIPFINMASQAYVAGGISLVGSEGDLIGISKELGGLINLFRLYNISFLENMVAVWGPIYFSEGFIAISFLIPILAFSALLFGRSRRVLFFVLLSVLGLFLAKGVAPPFGELFYAVFKSSNIFVAYENPFEKLGIILPLGYAPLIGLSISSIYSFVIKRLRIELTFSGIYKNIKVVFGRALVILLCILVVGVQVWPMWNGYVFTSGIPPSNNLGVGDYVKVPKYYEDINDYVASNGGDYRALVLPLTGVGITYNWDYGYAGVDLSNQLFDTSVIGMQTGYQLPDTLLSNTEEVLFTTTSFWKFMSVMSAKYVIVRSDINYEARGLTNPNNIKAALNYTIEPSIVNGLVNISSPNVKPLVDNYDQNDWRMVWSKQDYTLNVDHNDTMQSSFSVDIQSGKSGLAQMPEKDYTLNIVYELPSNERNLSSAKYLLVWVKSSVAGVIWVGMGDEEGRSMNWWGVWTPRGWNGDPQYNIGENDTGVWKLLVLPFNSPTYIYKGVPDLKNIKTISVVLFTESNSTRSEYLKIGGIFLDSGELVKVEGLVYVKSFGELDLYELNNKYLLPRIYVVNRAFIANDINDFLYKILPSDDYDPRSAVVVLSPYVANPETLSFLEKLTPVGQLPKEEFVEINPSVWKVNVYNATSPFVLVFSETYYPGWKAYYGNVDWFHAFFSKPIPEEYHFVANGYANAWYINKTGSYTITLYFQPQSLSTLGSIASISALALSLTIVAYTKREDIIKLAESLKRSLTRVKFRDNIE